MPKRSKTAPAQPAPIQLPLFAEAATLVHTLPERDQHRYYRLEVWPDLFGHALLVCKWVASAQAAAIASIPIMIRVPPSTPLPLVPGPSAAAAIGIARYEQGACRRFGQEDGKKGSVVPEASP